MREGGERASAHTGGETRAHANGDGDPDMCSRSDDDRRCNAQRGFAFPREERTYDREKRLVPFPLVDSMQPAQLLGNTERAYRSTPVEISARLSSHYADDVCRCQYGAICLYCRTVTIAVINFNFRIPTDERVNRNVSGTMTHDSKLMEK